MGHFNTETLSIIQNVTLPMSSFFHTIGSSKLSGKFVKLHSLGITVILNVNIQVCIKNSLILSNPS